MTTLFSQSSIKIYFTTLYVCYFMCIDMKFGIEKYDDITETFNSCKKKSFQQAIYVSSISVFKRVFSKKTL